MKRVLLVGATDGIGRVLALHYADLGWYVGVVGRSPKKVDAVVAAVTARAPQPAVGVVADVTDPDAVERGFREAISSLGQMDLLIYCAGVMPPGDTPDERIRGLGLTLDVNVRGAIHWLERGAEYFEALGAGRLAGIGSVAGTRGRKGHPVYGASKAALHAYLEGLRHRLHGSGVGVSTVMAGRVRTRMLDPAAAQSVMAVDAERAAVLIARGLKRGREVFFVPARWGLVALVLRALPRWLFKRVAPP